MKKSKKKNTKPTGIIGPIVIPFDSQNVKFQPIKFPADKAEMELFIVKFLTNGLKKADANFYKLIGEPIQNPENDFDFTLPTKLGKEYLELMEVAVLEHTDGSYDDTLASYNCGEMADLVYAKLMGKVKKYGILPKTAVHLLLYTTDWRFRLNRQVLALIAYWCLRQEHSFKSILYFVPDDARHGEAKIIYPLPKQSLDNFDEKAARNTDVILGDLTRFYVNSDGSVSIRLGSPKKN